MRNPTRSADPAAFDYKLAEWLAGAQERIDAEFAHSYPNSTPPLLEIEQGPRYVRVVRADQGGSAARSAHAFIDKITGDVLKPASWKTPAKWARGNIFDEKGGLGWMSGASAPASIMRGRRNPMRKRGQPVVFRKWRDSGDVIALLPSIEANYGRMMMYEHVGQHGEGDSQVVMSKTVAAKPSEYADLMRELGQVGYKGLQPKRRLSEELRKSGWVTGRNPVKHALARKRRKHGKSSFKRAKWRRSPCFRVCRKRSRKGRFVRGKRRR